MGFGRWLLLSGVCLVLATEKSTHSVQWRGSLTKMDETGRTAYNGLVTRAQFYKDFVYLCIPRLKPNCKATLVRMRFSDAPMNDVTTENPNIELFPSWTPQTEGDCSCLQSAVDLYLDEMKILWVLDVGSIKFVQSNPTDRCYPKVLGINVETGKTEHVISLQSLIEPISRVQFIVADYDKDGKCYLYISDAATMSIIVWDVTNKVGHRVMLPDDVISENAPKDVLYLALVRKATSTLLYFTYRSGEKMFFIDTKCLRKEASTAKSSEVGLKPARLIILGTDGLDCVYFRYEIYPDIYKWNTNTPFSQDNFQLVHTGGQLTPTQVMPYYSWNVMMLCESNLSEYLNPNSKPSDAINSLTVMQVA
ncbi:uncharacterized protein LOC106664014 [Cimex lectularius]|uniref:Bee-milk protein n=1 Tax=Cimex lectularius TaxID=79782 RepID=A0A8I6RME4_CIMLE|nr:uncharacterized protein LOC106664014 [Cimex lectularius]XP_014244857.1 uncharacterized protein LOC106664014 [Cimex lectularius]